MNDWIEDLFWVFEYVVWSWLLWKCMSIKSVKLIFKHTIHLRNFVRMFWIWFWFNCFFVVIVILKLIVWICSHWTKQQLLSIYSEDKQLPLGLYLCALMLPTVELPVCFLFALLLRIMTARCLICWWISGELVWYELVWFLSNVHEWIYCFAVIWVYSIVCLQNWLRRCAENRSMCCGWVYCEYSVCYKSMFGYCKENAEYELPAMFPFF